MAAYDHEPAPQPENLMQRRLRKARGEAVDDTLDDLLIYDDDRPAVPEVYRPRTRTAYGSGGCAQATLYLVLGALAALLIGLFALNQLLGGVARGFQPPNLGALIATPTPTVITSAAVVQRIQSLSRLETAAYTV